jgi:hypothetical protein
VRHEGLDLRKDLRSHRRVAVQECSDRSGECLELVRRAALCSRQWTIWFCSQPGGSASKPRTSAARVVRARLARSWVTVTSSPGSASNETGRPEKSPELMPLMPLLPLSALSARFGVALAVALAVALEAFVLPPESGLSVRVSSVVALVASSVGVFRKAMTVPRLYESVKSEGAVDEATVIKYMSTIDQWAADISTGPFSGHSWVERDIYARDPTLIRQWALTVVSDAVNRKIENHCYPIIKGENPRTYERSWVFRSLLGAMWMQMMFLMLADRRCWWCDKPLDPGMPRHARFCKNNGRCRWKWNYNNGKGKSNKRARREARYH